MHLYDEKIEEVIENRSNLGISIVFSKSPAHIQTQPKTIYLFVLMAIEVP